MRIASVVFACLCAVALPLLDQAPPSQGTFVSAAKSTTNYGSNASLVVQVGGGGNASIQFDLSPLPSGVTAAQQSHASLLSAVSSSVWQRRGRLHSPWVAVGLVLLGASVLFMLIVIFPTNKQLLDPTLDSRSSRVTSLFRRWNRLHAIRSLLSATAFGLLLCRAAVR